MGTHTTVDLFDDGETYSTSAHVWGDDDDDEDLVYDEEQDTFEYDDEDEDNIDGRVITNTTTGSNRVMDPNWFERQQELLQEVILLKPKQRPPLPHPTDRQKAVLKQVKAMTSTIVPSPNKKKTNPTAASTTTETTGSITTTAAMKSPATTDEDMDDLDENDPIFRRQREIFHQMREEERIQQERQQQQQYHLHYPHHHDYQSHHPNTMKSPSSSKSSIASFQSPVSVVTSMLTAASLCPGTKSSSGGSTPGGAPSDDFPTMVAQWTNHSLLERQGDVLRESMKRSLETRQALHIRPTALPEYDHEHLTKILREIESSSHKIRQTYLQQQKQQQELHLQQQQEQEKAAVASSP
jgi:hypothetical protein